MWSELSGPVKGAIFLSFSWSENRLAGQIDDDWTCQHQQQASQHDTEPGTSIRWRIVKQKAGSLYYVDDECDHQDPEEHGKGAHTLCGGATQGIALSTKSTTIRTLRAMGFR